MKDALPQFAAHQTALRAGAGAVVGHAVQHFFLLAVRRNGCDHIPATRIFLSQVIEAEIGHNAIDPGVKRTLEAKARQVYVCPEKRLLINVLTILLRAGEMNGQAQNGAIVLPHQFFEGGGIALLGLADEQGVIHASRAAFASPWPRSGKSSSVDIGWSDASFACVRHDYHSVQTNLRSLGIVDHPESWITHVRGALRSKPCRPHAVGCRRNPRLRPARKTARRLR